MSIVLYQSFALLWLRKSRTHTRTGHLSGVSRLGLRSSWTSLFAYLDFLFVGLFDPLSTFTNKMWTIVHPLISQCSKSFNLTRGRVFGPRATLLGSQVIQLPPKKGYLPLKDYEIVALQQLSS